MTTTEYQPPTQGESEHWLAGFEAGNQHAWLHRPVTLPYRQRKAAR